jgi:hypothetical protein
VPRAKQPVSIAGIEFDALIDQSRQLDATIPQYVTEEGFKISDSIIIESETLSMTLYVTDTPVTWRSRHGLGRTADVCNRLESLYFSRTPVTVVTSEGTFTNMGIQSITLSKNPETGYAREIPITFKKIRTTAVRDYSGVASSYGNGGSTGVSAGTASQNKINWNSDSTVARNLGISTGAYKYLGLEAYM